MMKLDMPDRKVWRPVYYQPELVFPDIYKVGWLVASGDQVQFTCPFSPPFCFGPEEVQAFQGAVELLEKHQELSFGKLPEELGAHFHLGKPLP